MANRITPEEQEIVERSKDRRAASLEARIQRAERRRLQKMQAEQQAALEAQRANSAAQRDKQQNRESRTNAVQRANLSLGASNADFQNQQRLNDEQRRAVGQRDKRLNQFETDENRRKNRDLRERDQRQFGYTMAENEQQFGNQLERDYRQQGYTLDRDRLQGDQTLQRDVLQGGIQADRDERLNQFGAEEDFRQQRNTLERDTLQNDFQSERDARLNIFDTQRDVRRQQFEQVNIYRQQADEIASKWQERVAIAKQAGLDYSPAQREEMKQVEKAFLKNVINNVDLPDDMKERANIEFQRQMSTFIPEQKVSSPDEEISQQFYAHPQWGPLKRSVDRQGNPIWEPLEAGGMGDQAGMMRQQAQDQQRQTESLSKKQHERLAAFQSVYDQVETMLDANDRPKFDTPEKVMQETMRRFFPREKAYQADGLPPLGQFLNPDEVPKPTSQQQPTQTANPWRAQLEQRQANQSLPSYGSDSVMPRKGEYSPALPDEGRRTRTPVVVPTTQIDDQVKQFETGGDRASAEALRAIKDITAKHNGPPPDGSEDQQIVYDAMKYLDAKGISLGGRKTKTQRREDDDVSRRKQIQDSPNGGDFFAF